MSNKKKIINNIGQYAAHPLKLPYKENSREHNPPPFMQNEEDTINWNFSVQTDSEI